MLIVKLNSGRVARYSLCHTIICACYFLVQLLTGLLANIIFSLLLLGHQYLQVINFGPNSIVYGDSSSKMNVNIPSSKAACMWCRAECYMYGNKIQS